MANFAKSKFQKKMPHNGPKSKIRASGASQEEVLHNAPKSQIQNPAKKFGFCFAFVFRTSDFGPGNVPLGDSVTVVRGQRLESPLVRPFRVSWITFRGGQVELDHLFRLPQTELDHFQGF